MTHRWRYGPTYGTCAEHHGLTRFDHFATERTHLGATLPNLDP